MFYVIRKMKFRNGVAVMNRIVMATLRLKTAIRLVELLSLEDAQPLLTGWSATYNMSESGFDAYYIYAPKRLKTLLRGAA